MWVSNLIRAKLLLLLILPFSLLLHGCTADALRAPSIADNRLYGLCTSQLVATYQILEAHKDTVPPPVRQKVLSLLLAAEIDGQFKHYPICVDKLARARLLLRQTNLQIPPLLSLQTPDPSPFSTEKWMQ